MKSKSVFCVIVFFISLLTISCDISKDARNYRHYRKKGLEGDAISQLRTGYNLYSGFGVKKDSIGAIFWFELAAKQGNAEAQLIMGNSYSNGDGVNQDVNLAFMWYSKAASKGNSNAQYELGILYLNGLGVIQNYEEAAKLFKSAAYQGNHQAQYSLGKRFYNGEGVTKNYQDAYRWYLIACSNCSSKDFAEFSKARDDVMGKLKQSEITKVKEDARLLKDEIDISELIKQGNSIVEQMDEVNGKDNRIFEEDETKVNIINDEIDLWKQTHPKNKDEMRKLDEFLEVSVGNTKPLSPNLNSKTTNSNSKNLKGR